MTGDLNIHRDQLRSALREFFHVEDDLLFDGIESDLDFVALTAGETLVREGDASDAVWFLVSGRLRAIHDRDETTTDVVGEIARGETVGELGLVTGEPRTATILAVRNSLVARMSRASFESILKGRPQVSIAVMRTIIERFRRSERACKTRRRPVTLCLAPISDGVEAIDVAHRLGEILRAQGGHLRIVSSRDLAAFSDRDQAEIGEAGSAVGSWLDAAEAESATVILVADRDATAWSQSCLARADEVVLLAQAEAEPRISGLEAYCLNDEAAEFAPAQTLVLLHEATTRDPRGTAAWLDRRPVARHVHVRPGLDRDMRRLARILSGRAVGFVLSGGGAKAFAPIGIMNALAEAGIEPDFVGGTGIGGILGAWRAMDARGEELVELGRRAFPERGSARNAVGRMPGASLMTGMTWRRRTERAVLELVDPGGQIEDSWLNYFCIAGNHAASAEVAFRRGPLVPSVLAGYALPGVLPPVAFDGPLYVEGGTVNNLPLDVMERLGAGTIIGIEVLPEGGGAADAEMVPRTMALLLDRLRPPAKRRYRLPSLPDMPFAIDVVEPGRRQRVRERPDIAFRPQLGRIAGARPRTYDQVVAWGRQSAIEHLASLAPERLDACR